MKNEKQRVNMREKKGTNEEKKRAVRKIEEKK